MAQQTTADFQEVVQALLNEDQLFSLRERRDQARQNFVRPVRMVFGHKPGQILSGFTRDLSDKGIGLIHKFEIARGDRALITINRLWDEPVALNCIVAWCAKSENGWFQSGWQIDSVESTGTLPTSSDS